MTSIQFLEDDKNDWKLKKEMTIPISNSFLRLSQKKENLLISKQLNNLSYYISNCGTNLEFKQTIDNDKKLISANFCRARLCPMCSWRRSKKVFGQVSKIIREINQNKQIEYLFLTLTCQNVLKNDLKQQINTILKAFTKMFNKENKIKKICLGYFRALEVTFNQTETTYHPHIHCIIAVNKSYFTSRDYIKTKEWVLIWQKYLNVEYTPIVDIRKFKNNNNKSVAEVSKYSVKSTDLILDTEEKTDDNIITIHSALYRVRLIGMGGLFKEYHKRLNLDDTDSEEADLVNTDIDKDDQITTDIILKYNWHVGYRNYILEKK